MSYTTPETIRDIPNPDKKQFRTECKHSSKRGCWCLDCGAYVYNHINHDKIHTDDRAKKFG